MRRLFPSSPPRTFSLPSTPLPLPTKLPPLTLPLPLLFCIVSVFVILTLMPFLAVAVTSTLFNSHSFRLHLCVEASHTLPCVLPFWCIIHGATSFNCARVTVGVFFLTDWGFKFGAEQDLSQINQGDRAQRLWHLMILWYQNCWGQKQKKKEANERLIEKVCKMT